MKNNVKHVDISVGLAENVIDAIHEAVKKLERLSKNSNNQKYILENRLISVMCCDYEFTPDEYSRRLNNLYGYNTNEENIIRILKNLRISNPKERKELFKSAEAIADAYSQAITGNPENFNKLLECRKNEYRSQQLERIAAITIYEKYPELDKYNDYKLLSCLGSVYAKKFFYNMYDSLCHVYDFPLFGYGQRKKVIKEIPHAKALKRIEELEIELERTNSMFVELQDDFNNQLQESKISELTEFFAHLNSDKYGNILDQLLQVRKGIDTLKKEGYELPLEINGLFIMVKQLIQFTRDSHIDPIMKLHSKLEVTASDIEFCDYEGKPFQSDTDKKIVEVISPGWVYKDQNVRISRPRVRECL